MSVQGTGITPRATTPANDVSGTPEGDYLASPKASSSRVSSTSDDDVTQSVDDEEANSMLQGVVTMNQVGGRGVMFVCLFFFCVFFLVVVGCLTSQRHESVSQGRICSDNFTCCHTEIDQTFYLTQS